MIRCHVVGDPVAHSRSPAMFAAAFRALGIAGEMTPIRATAEALAPTIATLRAAGAVGASITLPHKVAVIAACDELAAGARAIGAVNCVHFQSDGRTVGHNTDAPGFIDGLHAAGLAALADRRALVLGAGGAARAVAHGLAEAGAEVIVVARDPATCAWAPARPWTELAALAPTAALVVDTTPIGLRDDVPHGVPVAALRDDAWVATLIYHRAPALIAEARARGLRTVDGRAMLAYQGARAFALWLGRPAPADVMLAAI